MLEAVQNCQSPKYQTINYKTIESGVFAFEPKEYKPNDTIPLPKMLRLEKPLKPCVASLLLCNPFEKVKVNGLLAGRKITGLFDTLKDGCLAGDVKEPNGKKSTLLLQFSGINKIDLFEANYLKIYYFFNYYVSPNRVDKFVYETFMKRQKKSYGF